MTRVLCLGNDILGDDAFGPLVARALGNAGVQVVESCESGLHLLDHILDCSRLIVVDSVQTGRAAPGTLYVLREQDLPHSAAACPHGIGLFDALALARRLGLNAPEEVTLIAVEAADCHTVGAVMHPAVEAAVRRVAEEVLTAETQRTPRKQ
jgi:hydrogenase maturation protease